MRSQSRNFKRDNGPLLTSPPRCGSPSSTALRTRRSIKAESRLGHVSPEQEEAVAAAAMARALTANDADDQTASASG